MKPLCLMLATILIHCASRDCTCRKRGAKYHVSHNLTSKKYRGVRIIKSMAIRNTSQIIILTMNLDVNSWALQGLPSKLALHASLFTTNHQQTTKSFSISTITYAKLIVRWCLKSNNTKKYIYN